MAQLKLNPPANNPSPISGFQTDEEFLNSIGDGEWHSVLENPIAEQPVVTDYATTDDKFEVSSELNQFLTRLVLKNMPHQYSEDKKWGKQEKRWDGIRLRRDHPGGRLETKRRYKMVNHGSWQKYSAQLSDPEKEFSIELQDLTRTKEGKTKFQVDVGADLNLQARQSKWVKGVQLFSFSAEGFAKIRLSVSCVMDIGLDFSNFPPDLVLQPEVTDARIHVDEFRLNRVSKAGGEVAQQVARRAKRELEKRIAEKEQKLVKKMNKEIDENRDDLRISTADALKFKLFRDSKEFLPEDVKQALGK